jgi:hypothetical protein
VPSTHLVLEESRQQQALGARRFHHRTAIQQRRVPHKSVEHHAEIRGSPHIDRVLDGDLGVVREHAGVVKQFVSIDCRLDDVLQALREEVECLPMVNRE